MAKPVDIIDRDPHGKWEGGKPDSGTPDTGYSAEIKNTLYKETRVLNEKVRKLEKMLAHKNLNTAEQYALKKSLEESRKSMKKVEEAAKAEISALAETKKYQQDSLRKLSELRKFYAARDRGLTTMPMEAQNARREELKMLRKAANILSELSKKDMGTGAGRLGTLKGLSRLDKMMEDFPDELKELFAEQTKVTEDLHEMQMKVLDERNKKQEELLAQQKEIQEDFRKQQEAMIKEMETQRKDAEDGRRKFLQEKAERAYDAKQYLDGVHKERRDSMRERGFGLLDRLGVGKASLGTLARGAYKANELRKSYRDGKTGIQKYMQARAEAKGKDISSLRFGLGNKTEEKDERGSFIDKFVEDRMPAKAVPVPDQTGNAKWERYAKTGSFDLKDQDENHEEARHLRDISKTLSSHAKNSQMFNNRMLAETKDLKKGRGNAANDEGGGGIGGGGMIKNLFTRIGPMLSAAAPALILAAAPVLLTWLGKREKEAIEKNPTDPKYKDNAYAMTLRKEADSVAQAGAMNQQKALKQLRPGEAKEYLKRMDEDKVDSFDGYTRAQVMQMANPTAPKDAQEAAQRSADMDKFNKIQTGAQKAAATADDNGDMQRLQARAPAANAVNIPAAGSADAAPVGAMGKPITADAPSGKGGKQMQGATGNGGMIKDGMGKYFTKSSGVDTDGVNPQMQSKLSAMGQEYFEQTGKKINFNSAYRSIADQEKLYKTMPKGMAARPGSSLHNFGLAVDIPSTTANELDKLGLLNKYGFERPIPGEKWHVQPKGMSVAAAKAGLYSADAPANQGDKGQSQGQASASPEPQTVADAQATGGPRNSSANQNSGNGGGQTALGNAGKAASPTSISVASVPTFDASDGMFLSLNMGVV